MGAAVRATQAHARGKVIVFEIEISRHVRDCRRSDDQMPGTGRFGLRAEADGVALAFGARVHP